MWHCQFYTQHQHEIASHVHISTTVHRLNTRQLSTLHGKYRTHMRLLFRFSCLSSHQNKIVISPFQQISHGIQSVRPIGKQGPWQSSPIHSTYMILSSTIVIMLWFVVSWLVGLQCYDVIVNITKDNKTRWYYWTSRKQDKKVHITSSYFITTTTLSKTSVSNKQLFEEANGLLLPYELPHY